MNLTFWQHCLPPPPRRSPLDGEGDHGEDGGACDGLREDRLEVAGRLPERPRVLVPDGVDLDGHRYKRKEYKNGLYIWYCYINICYIEMCYNVLGLVVVLRSDMSKFDIQHQDLLYQEICYVRTIYTRNLLCRNLLHRNLIYPEICYIQEFAMSKFVMPNSATSKNLPHPDLLCRKNSNVRSHLPTSRVSMSVMARLVR